MYTLNTGKLVSDEFQIILFLFYFDKMLDPYYVYKILNIDHTIILSLILFLKQKYI